MTRSVQLCIALLTCAAPSVAQLPPGELLLNSYLSPDALLQLRQDGTVVASTSGGIGTNWEGAAVLPDGRWATTRKLPSNGVNLFDGATGALVASWDLPPGGGLPGDVDAFSDGTLIVADQYADRVLHLTDDGDVLAIWPTAEHPAGVHVDPFDHVWIAAAFGDRVQNFAPDGTLLADFPVGDFPVDVVTSVDGSVWVALRYSAEAERYARDGTWLGSFLAGDPGGFVGLAAAPDGTLWTTSEGLAELRHFDALGTPLGTVPLGTSVYPLFLTMRPTAPQIGTSYCGPPAPNSTGTSARLGGIGVVETANKLLRITAGQLPPDQLGYLLTSRTRDFVPLHMGSQGTLCLGGTIGHFGNQAFDSGSAGRAHVDVDLTDLPPLHHAVQSGETWHFQVWYRDRNPGPTSNFTDGLRVAFP